jgi:hypothetical protein
LKGARLRREYWATWVSARKKPHRIATVGLQPSSQHDSVDRCQLRPGAGKNSPESRPCVRTGVSRRHEHLYFAAETLVPKTPAVNCMARVSIHAIRSFLTTTKSSRLPLPVPASIPRVFFSCPPVVSCLHQLAARSLPRLSKQRRCHVGKALRNPAVTVPRTNLLQNKVYALQMKFPCSI